MNINISKGFIMKIVLIVLALLIILFSLLLINFLQKNNNRNFEEFCNNINLIQEKIIVIYDKNKQFIGVNLSNSTNKEKYQEVIDDIKIEYGIDILSENYYYLDKESRDKLELINLEDDYIVNYITSEVYDLNPINYNGKKYYTNLKIDNSLKGVAKYDVPPIPQGFRHTEGTWDTGLVIKDNYGNEFVWVPIGMLNETNVVSALKKYYREYDTDTEQTQEYIQVLNSLEKYQGFYIARYEASLQGATETSSQGKNNILQVVKNVMPVSKMSFSTSLENNLSILGYDELGNNTSNGEIRGAIEMTRNMASDYGWDKKGIGTCLMYSEQFDTLLKIIENKNLLKDVSYESSNPLTEDSVLWGNYINSQIIYKLKDQILTKNENEGKLIPTGAITYKDNQIDNRNCVFNIFDLAGNLSEWSMDASLNKYRSVRGGNYSMRSTSSVVANYEKMTPETASSLIGIRVVLYVN